MLTWSDHQACLTDQQTRVAEYMEKCQWQKRESDNNEANVRGPQKLQEKKVKAIKTTLNQAMLYYSAVLDSDWSECVD